MTVAVKETRGNFPLGAITDDFGPINDDINILKQIEHKNIIRYKMKEKMILFIKIYT
jgi:hypothetical protein